MESKKCSLLEFVLLIVCALVIAGLGSWHDCSSGITEAVQNVGDGALFVSELLFVLSALCMYKALGKLFGQ